MRAPLLIVCERERKAETYALALTACGVEPERIRVVTPETTNGESREVTAAGAEAAGVVLCGGPDIEPWRYDEEPIEDARLSLMPQLDALEWATLEGARSARTPIWAICRGLQILNVFLGGSLWQDLSLQQGGAMEHDVPRPRDALAHTVQVVADGHPLSERLASEAVLVNTRHHQALKRVAPELRILGRAADGVIEAAGGTDMDPRSGWWIYGVQWHPENLIAMPLQMRLWRDFCEAAKRHCDRRQGPTASE